MKNILKSSQLTDNMPKNFSFFANRSASNLSIDSAINIENNKKIKNPIYYDEATPDGAVASPPEKPLYSVATEENIYDPLIEDDEDNPHIYTLADSEPADYIELSSQDANPLFPKIATENSTDASNYEAPIIESRYETPYAAPNAYQTPYAIPNVVNKDPIYDTIYGTINDNDKVESLHGWRARGAALAQQPEDFRDVHLYSTINDKVESLHGWRECGAALAQQPEDFRNVHLYSTIDDITKEPNVMPIQYTKMSLIANNDEEEKFGFTC